MIRFGNLSIEGYCSIDKYETNLTTGRVTIIRGRNGAGKSSFLSALFWVLYGKFLKEGVNQANTWQAHRPKGYRGTLVSQYFEKGNEIHQVIRCSNYTGEVRGARGKNRLIYIIDNEEVVEKRKGGIQELIIKNLGMSSNLFLSSVMFGQGLKRLVQTSSTDKKDLFEEIFNITYISEAREIAKKEYANLSSKYNTYLSELSTSENLLAEYKKLSLEAKSSLENFQRSQKEALIRVNAKIKEAMAQLSNADTTSLKNRLAKVGTKKAELITSLEDSKREYKLRLASVDLSEPEVLAHFVDDLIRLIDTKPKLAKVKLLKMKDSLNYISNYNKAVVSMKESIISLGEKASKISSEISRTSQINSRLEHLKESLKEINGNKPPKPTNYSSFVKQYKAQVDKLKDSISSIKPSLDNYRWLIDEPLGNKGIKSYIFESSLIELNECMKEYAAILGFQVEFSIDLTSARKDFYTLIELEGNIVDYKELSGGQQQLVHLAMAFATHTMSTKSLGINILFLDEIFENLDAENIDIVVSLIRKMANGKSIYVISHKDSLPISNTNIISLVREKGLTVFN